MKRALMITVVLLAAFAGLGWRQGRELEALRAKRDAAGGTAARAAMTDEAKRPARRPRPDGVAEARRVAADFIAYAVEMDALGEEARDKPKGALRRRIAAQMREVTSLDGGQLRVVVDEIHAASELEDRLKRLLLDWTLRRLVESRPGEALAVLTPEMRERLGMVADNLVVRGLEGFFRDSPDAALAWYRENREGIEPELRKNLEWRLVHAAGNVDLSQALWVVDELGRDRDDFMPGLACRGGQTPEQRRVSLSALRAWCDEDPKGHEDAYFKGLGALVFGNDGYDETLTRMEVLDLSPQEMEGIVGRGHLDLSSRTRQDEAGRWAEWLMERFPEDMAAPLAGDLYRRWTEADYRAAEAWLESAAEGPGKGVCIRAFAGVMERYQPELARRWLEKLPAGSEAVETPGR